MCLTRHIYLKNPGGQMLLKTSSVSAFFIRYLSQRAGSESLDVAMPFVRFAILREEMGISTAQGAFWREARALYDRLMPELRRLPKALAQLGA